MGEMTAAIAGRIADLIAANDAALGPILMLTVCGLLVGLGRGFRGRLAPSSALSAQLAGLLTGLVVVALQVSQHGWMVNVDESVAAWLVRHRTPGIDQFALAVTNAFGPIETACLAIVLAVVAVVRFRSYLAGLVVIGTVGVASGLCVVLKLMMARSRPPVGIQETLEVDYSFPSGHVTGTVALVTVAVIVIGARRSATVIRFLMAAAGVVAVAVALSRLYLGVHWLTDVVAGALLALSVVAVVETALHGRIYAARDQDDRREGDRPPRPLSVVSATSRLT